MAAREKQLADEEKEAHAQWTASATNSAKQVSWQASKRDWDSCLLLASLSLCAPIQLVMTRACDFHLLALLCLHLVKVAESGTYR